MTRGYDDEALADIEHRLRAEDTEFVELFRMGRGTSGGPPGRDHRRAFTTAVVLAVLIAVLFVLAGQPAAAVPCCLAAGVLAVLRVRHCARRAFPAGGPS